MYLIFEYIKTYLSTTVLLDMAVINTENRTKMRSRINAMYVVHPDLFSQYPFTAKPSLTLPCG